MIKIQEAADGALVFVNGGEQVPVADEDVAAVLRDLVEMQADLDTAPAEQVQGIVQRSLVRLVTRALATVALGAQETDAELSSLAKETEAIANDPPSLEGYLLFSVDEIEKAMVPLGAVVQLVLSLAQQRPTNEQEAALVESYGRLAGDVGGLTAMFGYKLDAYKAAHEEDGEGGDEGDDDEDGDDDDGDDDGGEA